MVPKPAVDESVNEDAATDLDYSVDEVLRRTLQAASTILKFVRNCNKMSADLTKQKQIRNGHRTHVKKLIETIKSNPPDDKDALDKSAVYLATLEKKEKTLDEIDGIILGLITEADEVAKEIEDTSEFTEKLTEIITKLRLAVEFHKKILEGKLCEPKSPNRNRGSPSNRSRSSSHNSDQDDADKKPTVVSRKSGGFIRKPKIVLKAYDGSILKWNNFWDQFETAIHNDEDASDIEKFTYLKSYLIGDAERAIEGFATTKENYAAAIATLKSRFGNKQVRIAAHMKELRSVKAVYSIDDVSSLRSLYDTLDFNIKNLEQLSVDVQTYGSLLIAIIFERIPEQLRTKISLHFGETEWNLSDTLDVLRVQIEARERSVAVSGLTESTQPFSTHGLYAGAAKESYNQHNNRRWHGNSNSREQQYKQDKRDYRDNSSHNNRSRDSSNRTDCVFCGKNHFASRCRNVTDVNARYKIVKDAGLCFVCFKKHHVRECRLNYNCFNCGRKHNISLCNQKNERRETPDDSRKNDNNTRNNNPAARETLNSIALTTGEGQINNSTHTAVTANPATNVNVSLDDFTPNIATESKVILLQSALAQVCDPEERNFRTTCVLFDGCSHRTYVTTELRDKLKLVTVRRENLVLNTFAATEGKLQTLDVVQVCIKARGGFHVYVEALCVPFICSQIKSPAFDFVRNQYQYLLDVELADPPSNKHKVEILVGLDHYYSLISGRTLRGPPGCPVAIESVLGWIVCGPIYCSDPKNQSVLTNHISAFGEEDFHSDSDLELKLQLKKFWEIEEVPANEVSDVADIVHEQFKENTYFNGQRYVTGLPFKPDVDFVPDNFVICERRLGGLMKKLNKDPKLKEEYIKIFEAYENEQIISRCDDNGVPGSVHYLPHRPVIRSDKETTKVRPVFDASAKEKGGKSLNDCLYSGPCLLQRLSDIILRFCMKPIAIVADIKQAFLNIEIKEEHKNFLRFLFVDRNDSLVKFRFNRGIFGVNSLPFLMCATIKLHMNAEKTNNTDLIARIDQFLRDLYMDDVATAVDTVEEGVEFYKFSNKSMEKAGLKLRKWYSNSEGLREAMNVKEVGGGKILGVTWNKNDEFVFEFSPIVAEALKLPVTKRSILSIGARFYDPQGIISPITMVSKLYYQKVCLDKCSWDQVLPDENELTKGWRRYLKVLSEIGSVCVPRYLFPLDLKLSSINLHGYADASSQAYCSAVYVQVESGEHCFSRLISAKTKVAPIKQISIPKLELLACRLLVELMNSVCNALKDIVFIEQVVYWSDSEVALAWINGVGKKWGLWIQNRVDQIHQLSKGPWYHVPTSINPADIGTRESSGIQFMKGNKLWWEGPPTLLKKFTHPEKIVIDIPDAISFMVQDDVPTVTAEPVINLRNLITPENFSTLYRLLLVTGLVLRALNIMRRMSIHVEELELTTEETEKALELWIKTEQKLITDDEKKFKNLKKQLSLFVDSDEMIRLKGRLANSFVPYAVKHPILLDRNSHITKLIILQAHETVKHMRLKSTLNEIRSKYWITKARQTIYSLIRNCVTCKYITGSPMLGPAPPDLPEFRVAHDFAFTNVGVDFAGPLYVKDIYAESLQMHKAYILLFTCATTRNMHIELTPNMSTPCLLRALRRFIGRRGKCKMVISDNFKTFLSKELKIYLRQEGVTWKFILAKSPWWGAFYERLIRIIKESLKKCVGKSKLSYEEMDTILIEIEGVINSRPLTYIYGDDLDEALTPSHLLIGRRLLSAIPKATEDANENDEQTVVELIDRPTLNARYKYLQAIIDHFWKRFSSEYLTQLHEHHLSNKMKYDEVSKLLLGDVVLIKDDKLKRNCWRRGKVERLIEGRDGRVRGAVLKVCTDEGTSHIERPLRRIVPLEVTTSMT